MRARAAAQGRDPRALKFFATFTPIVAPTDAAAHAKHAALQQYASVVGGLVLCSGWTGIDLARLPLDQELTAADSLEVHKVRSLLDSLVTPSDEVPVWTPREVARRACIGGMGPVAVGNPATVADEMVRWIREADLDGFNLAYVTTPGTFEDVVDLLVPELRRRGLYPPAPEENEERLTAREKIYGKGQKGLREDHVGSTYKYAVYHEEPTWEEGRTTQDGEQVEAVQRPPASASKDVVS